VTGQSPSVGLPYPLPSCFGPIWFESKVNLTVIEVSKTESPLGFEKRREEKKKIWIFMQKCIRSLLIFNLESKKPLKSKRKKEFKKNGK